AAAGRFEGPDRRRHPGDDRARGVPSRLRRGPPRGPGRGPPGRPRRAHHHPQGAAGAVTQGDRALAELAEDYFQAILDASPFEATVFGVHGWHAEVPALSEAAEAEADRRLAGLERRLAAIEVDSLAGQDRITAAMLARGLADRR